MSEVSCFSSVFLSVFMYRGKVNLCFNKGKYKDGSFNGTVRYRKYTSFCYPVTPHSVFGVLLFPFLSMYPTKNIRVTEQKVERALHVP
jgi:hypothetical protein